MSVKCPLPILSPLLQMYKEVVCEGLQYCRDSNVVNPVAVKHIYRDIFK